MGGTMRRVVGFPILLAVVLATPAPAWAQDVELFNGRDLSGWDAFLVDPDAKMEDVFSVEDGILVVQGEPHGYLYTKADYESFRLVVEWSWPETPGNSGVLMRLASEPMWLPNGMEAQLASGNAGDMFGFRGFRIGGDEARLSEIPVPGWKLAKIEGNENPPGEWNRYEITVDGDHVALIVNGKKVNEATGCDVRPGRIGLQSEGGVVHFRTVTLTPLGNR